MSMDPDADDIPLALPPRVDIPPQLAPRTTSYSLLPPSPPHIHIPALPDAENLVLPAYDGVGGEDLTEADLKTITQVQHVAVDQTSKWKYERRREAQLILPFLYLGPSSVAKDKEFLTKEGITMLLVIRDMKSALVRLLNADKIAQELKIESAAVDVAGPQALIAAFPVAIKHINDHLLSVFRRQALNDTDQSQGNITINPESFQRGKVLVFCESGNERSACVVAAYVMAMYGMDLVHAVQFVQSQRFCVALGDDMKGLLWSFQDILQAQRDVGKANHQHLERPMAVDNPVIQTGNFGKRHIEDTFDEDTDMEDAGEMDEDRFEGRAKFVPFVDSSAP
jgi:serine/threonine/tyrosine-interacting protein